MTDPLEVSRYSVDHAKRRNTELKAEILAFGETGPHEQFTEIDRKTGETLLKVRMTRPLPRTLKGVAFDVANALRSALDQAGFAVAIAAGTNGNHAHFPFGGNAGDVQAKRKKGRSRDIPEEVFDVMAASKPYKGGNNILWVVNKICNTNKHEILVPLVAESGGFTMNNISMSGPMSLGGQWNRSKNEMEIARLKPGATLQANFEFRFFVALGDVGVNTGHDAVGTFDAAAGEVERVGVIGFHVPPEGGSVSKRPEFGPNALDLRNQQAEGGDDLICLPSGPLVPQDYVEGKADLHVHYCMRGVEGRPRYFCAVFNRPSEREVGAVRDLRGRARERQRDANAIDECDVRDKQPVLISRVVLVDDVDGRTLCVGRLERLVRLDQCKSVRPNLILHCRFATVESGPVEISGEVAVLGDRDGVSIAPVVFQGERPIQVVKGAAEVVDAIPDQQRPRNSGGLLEPDDEAVHPCFSVNLSEKGVTATIDNKGGNRQIKSVEVLLCPRELGAESL